MKKKNFSKIMIIGFISIVLIIGIVLTVAMLFGGHRVIKVESYDGEVTLERESREKDMIEGMNLRSNDTITTGNDGLVELLVDADKHILAQADTCFEIVSSGNETNGKLKIKLEYGTSLIEIENKLPEGAEVEVETPNASLSVRGTTFEVYYDEADITVVKVIDGVVEVVSENDSVEVAAGQMATVQDDYITVEDYIVADDDITAEDLSIVYKDVSAFEARYWNGSHSSEIYVKELVGWDLDVKETDSNRPDEYVKDGVRIRYWVLTETETTEQIDLSESSGVVESMESLENDDGDMVTCAKYDFNGQSGSIEIAYQYYKKVTEDVYLSIMVYDEDGGESLGDADIATYLPLTNNCYYIYE